MSRPPVALILRALGLGDFLTGIPALRLLRLALPGYRLVLAAPRHFAPLVTFAAVADQLVHGHELTPLVNAPERADVAVDLHGNGEPSRALLLAHRPRRLVAYTTDGAARYGSTWQAEEHEVARWCRLVAETFDVPADAAGGVAESLPVPTCDVPTGVTVVHPGAAYASRRWPPERFAEVAATLRDRGHRVLISGGPTERELANGIAAAAGVETLLGVDLLELFAVVAGARLVVSGDTGVAHIASAYRTPSVTLFGPVPPSRWGPPPDARHQALYRPSEGEQSGDPHGAVVDPALLRLDVETVLAATERALLTEPVT